MEKLLDDGKLKTDLAQRVHSLIRRFDAFAFFRKQLLTWKAELCDGRVELLPLPDRELSVPEKFTVLAAIHDKGWKGKKINPWPDPYMDPGRKKLAKRRGGWDYSSKELWEQGIKFGILLSDVQDIPVSDLASLEFMLEDVEKILAENKKENASGKDDNLETGNWWYDSPPPEESKFDGNGPIVSTLKQMAEWLEEDPRITKNHNGKSMWIQKLHARGYAFWFATKKKYAEVNQKSLAETARNDAK